MEAVTEQFFQFIWRYNLYQATGLHTADGEPVTVLFAGRLNTNAGPDFEEARVRVGSTLLVGNVELHLRTSDWFRHGHQHNEQYSSIILHVVWQHDLPEARNNHVPVLELGPHISGDTIANYLNLQHNIHTFPCAAQLPGITDIVREAWLNRMLAERWEMKLAGWDQLMQESAGDWRVLLYWRLAANFGFKLNADAFLALARSLPVNILGRHHEHLFRIEALLFGQAGMLQRSFKEEYPFRLKKEYEFLRKKYRLQPINPARWKFMRLRPANFPTVRIAQFAALIHRSLQLFTKIVSSASVGELTGLFELNASEYWDTHFRFDEEQPVASVKQLGKDSIDNIIVNTVAPLRFMYSSRSGIGDHCMHSLQLLEQMPPEENRVLREWEAIGWKAANAAQAQGLLQLHNHYCSFKQCLSCSIGYQVIRSAP